MFATGQTRPIPDKKAKLLPSTIMTTESKSTAAGQMWLNALMRSRQGSLVLLIAVLTVLTTALNPRFISPQSLKDLMLNVSIIALLVLGRRLSS